MFRAVLSNTGGPVANTEQSDHVSVSSLSYSPLHIHLNVAYSIGYIDLNSRQPVINAHAHIDHYSLPM